MGILRRHLTKIVALGGEAALLLSAQVAHAQSREYELKAVFLLNFAQYVKWPASALPAGAPITIGIVGGDPFEGELEKAVQGESVGGHKIVVRHGGDMHGCQLIFLSKSAGLRLTVNGGHIQQIVDGEKKFRDMALIELGFVFYL